MSQIYFFIFSNVHIQKKILNPKQKTNKQKTKLISNKKTEQNYIFLR